MRTMLSMWLVAGFVLYSRPCSAADLKNEHRAYFEKCELARSAFLATADRDIKTHKQLVAKTKAARFGAAARRGKAGEHDFPTKEAKDEALELYEAALQQMELLTDLVRNKDRIVAPDTAPDFPRSFVAQVVPVGERSGTALLTVSDDAKRISIKWGIGVKIHKIPAKDLIRVGTKKKVEEKVLEATIENGRVKATAQGIELQDLIPLLSEYLAEKKRNGLK